MDHAPDAAQLSVAFATTHGCAGACVQDASRWALCGVLALSAAAKLLSPYHDEYVVPEPVYYLGAAVELAAVLLLQTRYRPLALATAIALALAGITLAIMVPGRPCGCLGSLIQLDGASHVLVSGFVGALACLSLRPVATQRVPAGSQQAPCQADVPR